MISILVFKNISFARREISYLRVAKKYALFIYFYFGVFKNNQSVMTIEMINSKCSLMGVPCFNLALLVFVFTVIF